MYYLYGVKRNKTKKLVATFTSEQQLLAYARWSTLQGQPDGPLKFEQGSALIGYDAFEYSCSDDAQPPVNVPISLANEVPHNPSPAML